MVRNVRYLYNKLGTTDFSATGQTTVTGALSSLQSATDSKAPATHSHTVSDLPVSSSQVNSTNYVPTCALLYSMNEQLEAISSSSSDVTDLIEDLRPGDYIIASNQRYSSVDNLNLGIWKSTADVDAFFEKYNHNNDYKSVVNVLRLGSYVTIQDGTYNRQWEIAGFDMEHNQTAADGTIYDNGYGICLVPKTYIATGQWNTSNTNIGGYKSSYMHNTVLPNIVTKLKTVLGSHIVNRNVLLSSTVTSGSSSAYTWTTAEATLMSIGQMTGEFASNSNKYDDGEANYKLPLFNYEDFKTDSDFWSRGAYSTGAWYVDKSGSIAPAGATFTFGVRPLIYLR